MFRSNVSKRNECGESCIFGVMKMIKSNVDSPESTRNERQL
jgi:hypothetical protein